MSGTPCHVATSTCMATLIDTKVPCTKVGRRVSVPSNGSEEGLEGLCMARRKSIERGRKVKRRNAVMGLCKYWRKRSETRMNGESRWGMRRECITRCEHAACWTFQLPRRKEEIPPTVRLPSELKEPSVGLAWRCSHRAGFSILPTWTRPSPVSLASFVISSPTHSINFRHFSVSSTSALYFLCLLPSPAELLPLASRVFRPLNDGANRRVEIWAPAPPRPNSPLLSALFLPSLFCTPATEQCHQTQCRVRLASFDGCMHVPLGWLVILNWRGSIATLPDLPWASLSLTSWG
jgi:hypothetical protein